MSVSKVAETAPAWPRAAVPNASLATSAARPITLRCATLAPKLVEAEAMAEVLSTVSTPPAPDCGSAKSLLTL